MELTDLTRDQRVALVALVEAIVMADGGISGTETAGISKLAEAFGDEDYRDLLGDVNRKYEGVDELKSDLQAITDRQTRDVIFGAVMEDVMAAPSAHHAQSELLQWLTEVWGIQVKDAPHQ